MDTVKGARILCLSTRYVGRVLSRLEQPSNTWALPQHTLRGLRHGTRCGLYPHSSLPQHTLRGLRPTTPDGMFQALGFASAHATWIASFWLGNALKFSVSLPQHTLRGLRRQKYIKYFALFCRMCCKLVDSFSVEQRMLTALTIFPDFSAAKATYVAIIDSLGRTIDRFLWCEHPVFFLLTSTSPDAHTGRCLWHLA